MYFFLEYVKDFQFITLDEYQTIEAIESRRVDHVLEFSGELERGEIEDADFLYVSPGYISGNDKAKRFLEKFYREQIQVFPVKLKNTLESYYIFSALDVVDVLDRQGSEVFFYKSEPSRVKRIEKYSFYSEPKVTGIFKIPETKNVEVLCDKSFKDRYLASGLTGLRFVECAAE